MDAKEPSFDADGRDPELVYFWEATARYIATPFRREDVPPGTSFTDFWRKVMEGATTVMDCAERLQAYIEGRQPVLRFDSHLTTSQRWMRSKRQQKRNAEEMDASLRDYLKERESKLGPNDEFVRFMKSMLPTTKPPSSNGNQ